MNDIDDRQHPLFSPSGFANPFPIYAELRASEPVLRVRTPYGRKTWLITRFADAEEVLARPYFSSDPSTGPCQEGFSRRSTPLSHLVTTTDPPDHTVLRDSVRRAFSPRQAEALRPRIQQVADELVDDVIAFGAMDVAEDYAYPLPMKVMTELLGVPAGDADLFREWSRIIIETDLGLSPEVTAQRRRIASDEIVVYFTSILAERHCRPRDDLASRLAGCGLSISDQVGMLWLLLADAYESVGCLITNAVVSLLRRPEQAALLRSQPPLIGQAVEEFLRFDSSAATVERYATEDVELGGQRIARGDLVTVVLSSANHDEARFEAAEDLRLDRAPNHHIAFGKGIHVCLGAALARAFCQIGIATLVCRLPGLTLSVAPEELSWRASLMLRGLHTLPVEF